MSLMEQARDDRGAVFGLIRSLAQRPEDIAAASPDARPLSIPSRSSTSMESNSVAMREHARADGPTVCSCPAELPLVCLLGCLRWRQITK